MGTIAENIRRLREKNKWSQITLSEKTGIAQSSISEYENGKSVPDYDNMKLLAHAFHCSFAVIDESTKDISGKELYSEQCHLTHDSCPFKDDGPDRIIWKKLLNYTAAKKYELLAHMEMIEAEDLKNSKKTA